MNRKFLARLLAVVIAGLGIFMLVPMFVGIGFKETVAVASFAKTICLMFAIAIALYLFSHNCEKQLGKREGYLLVTLVWIVGTALGALPLLLSGSVPTYSDAFFEIMSGFTTTGASILTDIEGTAKSILFWRSMTNWFGGMGIVVLFVALLPAMGGGGNLLMGAESVGPQKGKLTPKTKNTAMALWLIYVGLSVIETLFLVCGGVSLYDSVTVTFSTMSAAGFCVKAASIGGFNSAYVDVVVTVFMIAAGMNFALYYKAITGKWKQALADGELHTYLEILLVTIVLCALGLTLSGTYSSFFTSLRYAAFQLASIITTTGFVTANFELWPSFCQMLLFLMMFIGGCAGSAGGGMKVIRVKTLFRLTPNQLKSRMHPSGVFNVRSGNEVLDRKTIEGIAAFCSMYIATWIFGSILVSLSGCDVLTAVTAALQALGNIGVGFSKVGPSGGFAFFPLWTKWVLSALMLMGRLELYTVFVIFSKGFRDR